MDACKYSHLTCEDYSHTVLFIMFGLTGEGSGSWVVSRDPSCLYGKHYSFGYQ
jgi:hypothetical protein